MKVLHITTSDSQGGADIAATRLSNALNKKVDSSQWVRYKNSNMQNVTQIGHGWNYMSKNYLKTRIANLYKLVSQTENQVIHSPQIFDSSLRRRINKSEFDVVNMHYVQDELLSIKDLSKITKPCVFTLHDMWLFTGAEHYTKDYRYRDGYLKDNRPAGETGFDVNKWCWERKMRSFKKPHYLACPSHWIAKKARKSLLLKDWPIEIIPNAIDTEFWKPSSQVKEKEKLGISKEIFCIGFGADYGNYDKRKGFDLLESALKYMAGEIDSTCKIKLILFGRIDKTTIKKLPFDVISIGHIKDKKILRGLYSCLDVFVAPSRLDNLPNTVVEAQCCGTPVVAFRYSGLQNMIVDKVDGKLAKPFDIKDLGRCIIWCLGRGEELGRNARLKAVQSYSEDKVSEKYLDIYRKEIELNRNR